MVLRFDFDQQINNFYSDKFAVDGFYPDLDLNKQFNESNHKFGYNLQLISNSKDKIIHTKSVAYYFNNPGGADDVIIDPRTNKIIRGLCVYFYEYKEDSSPSGLHSDKFWIDIDLFIIYKELANKTSYHTSEVKIIEKLILPYIRDYRINKITSQ